jgi:hypothetical protein
MTPMILPSKNNQMVIKGFIILPQRIRIGEAVKYTFLSFAL